MRSSSSQRSPGCSALRKRTPLTACLGGHVRLERQAHHLRPLVFAQDPVAVEREWFPIAQRDERVGL